MKSGVFMTKNRVKRVFGAMAMLPQQDVLVGVPGDETQRDAKAPITNAALAYIHDNGAPEANIPARPFMHPGIDSAKDEILVRLKNVGKAVLDGNMGGAERALHAAGLTAQSAIRRKINTGPFLPLAPYTLAQRRRRGRTSDKPLVDTAQMRNSITYVVRTNKKATVLG